MVNQSKKDNKQWKDYEETTYKVAKELKPKSAVSKNVRIEGKLSKVKRQVDVKVVDPDEYDFLAIECKDLSRPVDVPIIEAFNTKLKDIGTTRGAVVANSPYTEGSQNMADALGIDLLHVIDTGNKNIRTKIYANAVISDVIAKSFKVHVSMTSLIPAVFPDNPRDLMLGSEGTGAGTAYDIFANLWNDNDTPFSRTPGTYKYIPPNSPRKYIMGGKGEQIPVDELSFIYEVVEKHFMGQIEIVKAKGLYNVRQKSFQGRELITQKIVPYELEKIWKEITVEELKTAQYTFGMSMISMFPVERDEE